MIITPSILSLWVLLLYFVNPTNTAPSSTTTTTTTLITLCMASTSQNTSPDETFPPSDDTHEYHDHVAFPIQLNDSLHTPDTIVSIQCPYGDITCPNGVCELRYPTSFLNLTVIIRNCTIRGDLVIYGTTKYGSHFLALGQFALLDGVLNVTSVGTVRFGEGSQLRMSSMLSIRDCHVFELFDSTLIVPRAIISLHQLQTITINNVAWYGGLDDRCAHISAEAGVVITRSTFRKVSLCILQSTKVTISDHCVLTESIRQRSVIVKDAQDVFIRDTIIASNSYGAASFANAIDVHFQNVSILRNTLPLASSDDDLSSATDNGRDSTVAGAVAFSAVTAIRIDSCEFRANRCEECSGADIFAIDDSTPTHFVVENSVFSGGLAVGGNGGSIVVLYSSTTSSTEFINCRFEHSQSSGLGGAILQNKGNFMMKSSIVYNVSSKRHGGAVALIDTPTVSIMSTMFTMVKATSLGGALFVLDMVIMTLYDVKVVNAGSGSCGGAIFVRAEEALTSSTAGSGAHTLVELTSSTFTSSNSNNGGALCIYGPTVTIHNSSFSNSAAMDTGGAVFAQNIPFMRIVNTSFLACRTTTGSGGGVYGSSIGALGLYISNCSFSDCVAAMNGGGIDVYNAEGVVYVKSSIFQHCATSFADGGAVALTKAVRVSFTSLNFSNNAAVQGNGGGLFAAETFVDFSQTYWGGNTAVNGGSISLDLCHGEVRNSLFEDGGSVTEGGAVYIIGGNLSVYNLVLRNLYCNNGIGAAFSVASATMSIRAVNIRNVQVRYEGGSLYCANSNVSMSETSISGSLADTRGGAVFVDRLSSFTVSGGTMHNCTSLGKGKEGGGGAVFVEGKAVLSKVVISMCEAVRGGGGVYAHEGSNLLIVDVTITNSHAPVGAALEISGSSTLVIQTSITDCQSSAKYEGGGVYILNNANVTMQGVRVMRSGGDSHGCLAVQNSSIKIVDATFQDCHYNRRSTVEDIAVMLVDDSEFKAHCGGCFLFQNSDVEVLGTAFSSCVALGNVNNGGCVCSLNSVGRISSTTMSACSSENGLGGGLYSYASSILYEDVRVTSSSAVRGAGGSFQGGLQQSCFRRVVFDNNHAWIGGGYEGPDRIEVSQTRQCSDLQSVGNSALVGPQYFYSEVYSTSVSTSSIFTNQDATDSSIVIRTTWANNDLPSSTSGFGDTMNMNSNVTEAPSPPPTRIMYFIPGKAFHYRMCLKSLDIFQKPFAAEAYRLSMRPPSSGTVYDGSSEYIPLTSSLPSRQNASFNFHSFESLSFDTTTATDVLDITIESEIVGLDPVASTFSLRRAQCPEMYYFNTKIRMCDPCALGSYRFGSMPSCVACPAGVICTLYTNQLPTITLGCPENVVLDESIIVSTSVKAKPGYWWTRTEHNTISVMQCAPGYCSGGDNECAAKHLTNSTICSKCADGYHIWGSTCMKCDGIRWEGIALRVGFALFYVFILHKSSATSSASLPIVTSYLEVVAIVFEARAMEQPQTATEDETGTLVSRTIQGILDLGCFAPLHPMEQHFVLWGHFALLVFFTPLVSLCLRRFIPLECIRHTFCAVLVLSVQMIGKELVQAAACFTPDPVGYPNLSVMLFQPTIECGTADHHNILIAYAVLFGCILIVLGGGFVYIRVHKWDHPWPVLFGVYRNDTPLTAYWMWIIILRRMTFVVVYVVCVNYGTPLTLVAMLNVAIVFLVVQIVYQPYSKRKDNFSETIALLGIASLCPTTLIAEVHYLWMIIAITLLGPVGNVISEIVRLLHRWNLLTEEDEAVLRKIIHPAALLHVLDTIKPSEVRQLREDPHRLAPATRGICNKYGQVESYGIQERKRTHVLEHRMPKLLQLLRCDYGDQPEVLHERAMQCLLAELSSSSEDENGGGGERDDSVMSPSSMSKMSLVGASAQQQQQPYKPMLWLPSWSLFNTITEERKKTKQPPSLCEIRRRRKQSARYQPGGGGYPPKNTWQRWNEHYDYFSTQQQSQTNDAEMIMTMKCGKDNEQSLTRLKETVTVNPLSSSNTVDGGGGINDSVVASVFQIGANNKFHQEHSPGKNTPNNTNTDVF